MSLSVFQTWKPTPGRVASAVCTWSSRRIWCKTCLDSPFTRARAWLRRAAPCCLIGSIIPFSTCTVTLRCAGYWYTARFPPQNHGRSHRYRKATYPLPHPVTPPGLSSTVVAALIPILPSVTTPLPSPMPPDRFAKPTRARRGATLVEPSGPARRLTRSYARESQKLIAPGCKRIGAARSAANASYRTRSPLRTASPRVPLHAIAASMSPMRAIQMQRRLRAA